MLDYLVYYSLDLPDSDMRTTTSEIALNELGLEGSPKLWIGKDYINFIVKDFEHLHKPYQGTLEFFSNYLAAYVLYLSFFSSFGKVTGNVVLIYYVQVKLVNIQIS